MLQIDNVKANSLCSIIVIINMLDLLRPTIVIFLLHSGPLSGVAAMVIDG